MKKLLLTLLLIPSSVFAECVGFECIINDDQGVDSINFNPDIVAPEANGEPCIGLDCAVEDPEEPTVIATPPPLITPPGGESFCAENSYQVGFNCVPFIFNSHQEAEAHWYHCALGIQIWGELIQREYPDFVPIKPEYDTADSFACYLRQGFEVEPNSNICSSFSSQQEAEQHYQACAVTNFQYWVELEKIRSRAEKPCDNLGWGGAPNNQARWKPVSETTGNLVVLLPNEYCSSEFGAQGAFGQTFFPLVSNMRIEDQFGNVYDRGQLRHCGQHNNGRLHWNFGTVANMPSPVFLRYEFKGQERCRRVDNPRSDLGR